MRNLINKLTHKHEYFKTGFNQSKDNVEYECKTCGKIKWEDSRSDDYDYDNDYDNPYGEYK